MMEKKESTPDDLLSPPAGPGDILVVGQSAAISLAVGIHLVMSRESKEILEGIWVDYCDVLDPEGTVRMVLIGNLQRAVDDGGVVVLQGKVEKPVEKVEKG